MDHNEPVRVEGPKGRDPRPLYSVNQLAEELGVTPRAIRFYEAKGLITPQRVGQARVFDRRDRARLLLVLRGKRLGFSLGEIKDYLDLYDADRTQAGQLRLLLAGTEARIAALEAQRRDLDQALAELRDIQAQARAALAARGRPAGRS
ncbi:Predicted transcriptional regulator LiuR of leucine degradation pathway, MerR family [Rhodovastum atsumiense]|uniref:MerR family DNA-binding transcriptional regulator n=1 Tax=Rhodovastum atsumiense TaxID=504468 RepID=A0A5M6IMH2_9PROT|nr:MerR family DNA-binding transcriptional regulator [Rhodovastum atsumiense]KAA5609049.1 MerR family DNA-binding transcriptional regulator [Rhodovastum atsumiense]CAH2604692.1 Predicted transcriptional regulator LiuR of leucine degradation pathway, MerR family [Rhodovastum atsumiense]